MKKFLAGQFAISLVLASALPFAASPASAQTWDTATGAGGIKVARVAMSGGASSLGLACEGALPVLAINLRQPPRRNPALLTLRVGAASGAIVITRNGATSVWAAAVRDPRVLNALASGQSVALAVDGVSYGSVPLAGAGEAMRAALGGCWAGASVAGGGATARAPGKPEASGAQRISGLGEVMAVADTSSPVTLQTSFPMRDPQSGKPRLPVKLGAWIPAGATCARPGEKLMFVDVGGSVGDGEPDASNEIQSIRQLKPGSFSVREDIGVQDYGYRTATYVIADPEHFTVHSPGNTPARYSFCSQESLPFASRNFLKSEHRRVPALPVRSGYYLLFESFDPADRATRCQIRCGFALVTSAGIAHAFKSGTSYDGTNPDPKRVQRRIERFGRIMQTAPGAYENHGTESYPTYFSVKSPTSFSSPDGETETHYEPVEPGKIPASLMPRF